MPTDRQSLLEHLRMTERHIAEGEDHLVGMEIRIAELVRDGHSTEAAESLLETLRETQRLHRSDRALVLKQIEELDRA